MIYLIITLVLSSIVFTTLAFKWNIFLSQLIKDFPNRSHSEVITWIVLCIIGGFLSIGSALYFYFLYFY